MKKTIKFTSEFHNLSKAEEILAQIAEKTELSEEIYGNILLSLSEAINNAIIHGNKMAEEKYVTVTYEIDKNCIEITVSDQGEGFDPSNIPDPTLPENLEKETGRGLFIIKTLSDKLEFLNNGTTLKMRFNLNK